MINWLHAKSHRPESGWDPVSPEHASVYAKSEWEKLDESCLDEIETWLCGFSGKRVIDLGGGPGQYSVAMARRGANVIWHDVSRTYQRIAEEKTQQARVSMQYSLGYLEEALRNGEGCFDLVFNRICWYYGRSDRGFASLVWRLLKPGGVAYVDTNNSSFKHETQNLAARIRTNLNNVLGIKIGHPMPPRGRIAHLFNDFPIDKMLVDYTRPTNDRVIFLKSKG